MTALGSVLVERLEHAGQQAGSAVTITRDGRAPRQHLFADPARAMMFAAEVAALQGLPLLHSAAETHDE